MQGSNFFAIFVGVETPDIATLIQTQKRQNTRRDIAESIHRIYRAGMFVNAGYILGFDSEEGSVAEAMCACIEETAIPAAWSERDACCPMSASTWPNPTSTSALPG